MNKNKYLVSLNTEEPENALITSQGFQIEGDWVIFYNNGAAVAAYTKVHVIGVERLEE